MSEYTVIGAVERIALPDLGVKCLRARVDTGAASSALHVDDIALFTRSDSPWASFKVMTGSAKDWRYTQAQAPLIGTKYIRNTGGEVEERHVIRTSLTLGQQSWLIAITLTNRDKMRYRMLLGRSALQNQVLVNPSRLYLHAYPTTQIKK